MKDLYPSVEKCLPFCWFNFYLFGVTAMTVQLSWISCFFAQAFGKREPEQELEAQEWIETITEEKFPEGTKNHQKNVKKNSFMICFLLFSLPGNSQ